MGDGSGAPAGAAIGPATVAMAPATVAVAAGRPPRTADGGVNAPVELSSTFVASAGATAPGDRVYGRFGNPTWTAFEDALGALEGGSALAFSSGMAAISAVLAQLPAGAVVVAPRHGYSGTLGLLRDAEDRGLLRSRFADLADTASTAAAMDGAALLWVETPTNPMLEVADLPALVDAARAAGVTVAVDNTFATPLGLRPLEQGADVVLHSASKYLSGHSDVLLGAAVTTGRELLQPLHEHRTRHGAIPGPWEAWLALRGLRTLHVRMERACANAVELAARLQAHPAAERVRHPSLPADPGHARAAALMQTFGAVIGLEVRGGADAAERVASGVRLWLPATSLGGVESMLERRRRHAVETPTVPAALLRLSVGIEDVEDLWADLDAALTASRR